MASTVTNDTKCTSEITSRNAIAKAATRRRTLFTSKLEIKLQKKPVKCNIWSIALCGAETWSLQKVDQKYLGSFENVVLEKKGEDQLD